MYSEEYAIFPCWKWEINFPFHFKPPDLLEVCNTVESRFLSRDMIPISPIINPRYGESLCRNAQTHLPRASIQPNFLGVVIKRINPTKPRVNPSFAQMGREIGEDAAEKNRVIGRQFRFPNKIGGGSAAKSAIHSGEFANLRRVHVGHDLRHATLRQLAQARVSRRFGWQG